ncbi:dolichyl-diphosphooligosaccharide--protein glycosyltransferase subunit 1A [Amborella trichopoda]|uniref:Dolichyl-diphosphooligosaccharide--protein glycosyltransferase subunit 1 n=1 Tax=Amborella trichopoda TaxID=13333 RepID=U5D4I6_AMBTC|nr:dolichyl-diphosphooligosaccharide--protein glycosyltransferase subunit 1A [Amborella trichopoda]ERN17120.1 hypothetical protein AMTR_s00044p00115050 [Amborella trichopoda]|eukprot:XP_006855653.1 dolichyl-diphosphooligosaccharide--protein glycosyltransferase subunit 1A [Amborella trichopoda]
MGRISLIFTLFLLFSIHSSSALSELVVLKVDRRVDLTSHIVRVTSTLKVENSATRVASEVLIALPNHQVQNLAYLKASFQDGKGKAKGSVDLPIKMVQPEGMAADVTIYAVSLAKGINKGEIVNLEVFSVYTHSLKPFPEEITQADNQLVLYQDSAYYLSPYDVKVQSLSIRVPSPRVESYTKVERVKFTDLEIKYGPYENIRAFSFTPIVVHFENNQPFAVVKELVREIAISHWGNVQVTEHYNLAHGGAQTKGGFSRIEYQGRPTSRGASSFRHLLAKLPPRAHSIYYRDHIGNISTSHLWGDLRKTELQIEPRYPMFGGWRTAFTIGYGLPLHDFLFESDGKRFLNISFGSPLDEVAIDNLVIKVILPEGSKDMSVSIPFPTEQRQEIKHLHLDTIGRPVVVLEKKNVVPEHNVYFQVYYKFNSLSMLREPVMLIIGFFLFFLTCIIYMHVDISISKSSAAYIAKQQWEEVQAAVHQVENFINHCIAVDEKLDLSLRDLSRTGDVQASKAARKTSDALWKEYAKEIKLVLSFLQSSPQAAQIWPKVDELVRKEKEKQERLMLKHSTVVEAYEKKLSGREIGSRAASHEQRIAVLKQEVEELLETVDEVF